MRLTWAEAEERAPGCSAEWDSLRLEVGDHELHANATGPAWVQLLEIHEEWAGYSASREFDYYDEYDVSYAWVDQATGGRWLRQETDLRHYLTTPEYLRRSPGPLTRED